MKVVAASDKFRGTATAVEADGGEGTLGVLGGPNRSTKVTGPLGGSVQVGWRLDGEVAVIETARSSGLALVGGMDGNDPMRASTRGTGGAPRRCD